MKVNYIANIHFTKTLLVFNHLETGGSVCVGVQGLLPVGFKPVGYTIETLEAIGRLLDHRD